MYGQACSLSSVCASHLCKSQDLACCSIMIFCHRCLAHKEDHAGCASISRIEVCEGVDEQTTSFPQCGPEAAKRTI